MSDDQAKLASGEDLAMEALEAANLAELPAGVTAEEIASDDFAQTLQSLEQIIERHANQLEELNQNLRERRSMLSNYFENDAQLAEAEEQLAQQRTDTKARKAQLQDEPQAVELKLKIRELTERRKEIQESLSNHLVNHHRLTNSHSFDTSDGDQWEYQVSAKVKSKPKRS